MEKNETKINKHTDQPISDLKMMQNFAVIDIFKNIWIKHNKKTNDRA